MILSSILTFARTQAQTNSDGISDEAGIIWANEAIQDFHRRLVEKNVDASQLQESSIVGTAGIGIYPYPTSPASILSLKTMEVNYVDSSNNNYRVAHQVDVANLPGDTSFSWLRQNADPNSPQFDDRGDKFEVFPTPTNALMIRMFGFAKPSIYTATTNTVNYPENLEEGILGFRIAANYKYTLQGEDNYVAGDKLNAKYEERVNQYINSLSRGSQQPIQATPLQITGWQY